MADRRELWKPDGAAICRVRRKRGWSQRDLAERAGLSPHAVERAERGCALLPCTLRLLAEVFGTPLAEISLVTQRLGLMRPPASESS